MSDPGLASLTDPQVRALRFLADGPAILSNETAARPGAGRLVSTKSARALEQFGLVVCTKYGRTLAKARLSGKGHGWLAENPAGVAP